MSEGIRERKWFLCRKKGCVIKGTCCLVKFQIIIIINFIEVILMVKSAINVLSILH